MNVAQVGVKPRHAGAQARPQEDQPADRREQRFGPQILFEAGKSIAKVAAVGGIAALALFPKLDELAALVGCRPRRSPHMLTMVLAIAQRAAPPTC